MGIASHSRNCLTRHIAVVYHTVHVSMVVVVLLIMVVMMMIVVVVALMTVMMIVHVLVMVGLA